MYATETISGKLHVVRGRYEVLWIHEDLRRLDGEDMEDMITTQ